MSNQTPPQGQPGGQFDFGGGSGGLSGQAPTSYGSAPTLYGSAAPAPGQQAPGGPGFGTPGPGGSGSQGPGQQGFGQGQQLQQGPPWGPPGQDSAEPKAPDGGVRLTAIIAIAVMVIAMGAVAIRGNRVAPFSAMTDSAWRNAPGQVGELTDQLRGNGYTCSDEGFHTDEHLHRICAKHAPGDGRTIEFGGTTEGDVMFVLANPGSQYGPEAKQDLAGAVQAALTGADGQQAAAVAAAGPRETEIVQGPWGSAGWDEAGQFHVTKGWGAPPSGRTPDGSLADLKAKAEQNQYRCDGNEAMLQCNYAGTNAQWTLQAVGTGDSTSTIALEALITKDEDIDVAEQLEKVLPEGTSNRKAVGWLKSVDEAEGHAGFARGLRMGYFVEGSDGARTKVNASLSTPCYSTEGSAFC